VKNEIRQILTEALNEVSPLLSESVTYRDDLVLWGRNGLFDSMTLVSFVSSVETMISDTLHKDIMIVSEKAFSQKHSPFKTMERLGNFIEELLNEAE
jgi:hypothetical protein